MIEEQARVVALDGEYALLETQRKSTCETCSINKGCGTAVISKALGRAAVQLRAINHINACVNQQVIVGIDERWLLRGSFAAYIVPLLLMLLCAGIGEMIGLYFWGVAAEGVTISAALVGLMAGFYCLRRYSVKLRRQNLCQPAILRSVSSDDVRIDFYKSPPVSGQD